MPVEQVARSRATIHVGTCTPLVIAFTGTRSAAMPGQIGCHICARDLAVQRADAVDAPPVRSASAVMLNMRPAAVVVVRRARGSARDAGRASPQAPARCFSTRWNGNAS